MAEHRRPVMSTTSEELSNMVAEYLRVRRALGYKLHHIEYTMDRYLGSGSNGTELNAKP